MPAEALTPTKAVATPTATPKKASPAPYTTPTPTATPTKKSYNTLKTPTKKVKVYANKANVDAKANAPKSMKAS